MSKVEMWQNTILARSFTVDQTLPVLRHTTTSPLRNKINQGNLKQLARRVKISNSLSLSIEEVVVKLRECKQQCKYYQGQCFRRKHLNKRLETAREKQDEEAKKRILQIIARE